MVTLAPPRAASSPRQAQPLSWRIQALLSAYLPLLLMAFLASGTWWLVKNTPGAEEAVVAAPARHKPDYEMKNFELQRLGPDGRLRVRIEGSELRHYPDTNSIEIDGIRLRAYAADGNLTLATASRGIGNAAASEIQLLGDVKLQRFDVDATGQALRQPRLEVKGEFMRALGDVEKLNSHLPVLLSYAGGDVRTQGFEFDNLLGQLSFTGRTAAHFEIPAKTKGRP
jgi:lipopolysaccharide export system protein LptC